MENSTVTADQKSPEKDISRTNKNTVLWIVIVILILFLLVLAAQYFIRPKSNTDNSSGPTPTQGNIANPAMDIKEKEQLPTLTPEKF